MHSQRLLLLVVLCLLLDGNVFDDTFDDWFEVLGFPMHLQSFQLVYGLASFLKGNVKHTGGGGRFRYKQATNPEENNSDGSYKFATRL